MTLDTKVQPNLVSDWRNIGGYDKSVDAIVCNVDAGAGYSWHDIHIYIPNPVAGDVYTVSFDAWGSTIGNLIRTYCLNTPDVLACAAGGIINGVDNGYTSWANLAQKSKRYFTTYRLVKESASYIIIRGLAGTTYVRNIKLEKSPYPTDYEGILEIDSLGGVIVSILLIMLATTLRKEVAA